MKNKLYTTSKSAHLSEIFWVHVCSTYSNNWHSTWLKRLTEVYCLFLHSVATHKVFDLLINQQILYLWRSSVGICDHRC